MELAYISIQGWIISSYVNSFFDGSEEVLVLPCQYTEIFNRDSVTWDVNVVIVLVRGPSDVL